MPRLVVFAITVAALTLGACTERRVLPTAADAANPETNPVSALQARESLDEALDAFFAQEPTETRRRAYKLQLKRVLRNENSFLVASDPRSQELLGRVIAAHARELEAQRTTR